MCDTDHLNDCIIMKENLQRVTASLVENFMEPLLRPEL